MAHVYGTPMIMRNSRTGAVWLVTYDFTAHTYKHEPVGLLSQIKGEVVSPSLLPRLELAGTAGKCAFPRRGAQRNGVLRQNHPATLS